MERTVLRNAILSCTALIGLGAAAVLSPTWATGVPFAEAVAPAADASKGAAATDPAPSVLSASDNAADRKVTSTKGKTKGKVHNLRGVQVVAPRTSIESARFTQGTKPLSR